MHSFPINHPNIYRHPVFEFHITRAARNRYSLDVTLFATSGNVIFANFPAAQTFAQTMNAVRNATENPELAIKAGDIYALGLIDELLHVVIAQYRQQINPQVFVLAEKALQEKVSPERLDLSLYQFLDQFPPREVLTGAQTIDTYLNEASGGYRHVDVTLEELLMLWLANANPAFAPFGELFDDEFLIRQTAYKEAIAGLREFFETQPRFGPRNQTLVEMLRAPALASPHSLQGQLEYILQEWEDVLGEAFSSWMLRLLRALDYIAEGEKPGFLGPGPALVPDYSDLTINSDAPERFSEDRDWMPSLVLLAKNVYVWLHQLSREYGREIHTLDQVLDEELAELARRGITGLWLIGLWERSQASKTIKQRMGQPDAVASAYSLYDYVIAQDLGGPDAMQNLRSRAGRFGIRMASDMVPNHMGMDSRWVVEHPDWFLSLPNSPFPNYIFNGPDLCADDRTGIYLEDHYYDHSDAAVVFKRVDHQSGETRYIYHGNDGTSLPWNDTAQLNFLSSQVREGVIQTILHVARQFPIIRFDAAMTLAKKHIQRLWFPEPGSGGAIASRAEHGLTKAQFNKLIPEEFWREVVDRVAEEAPDTLLLAEAFWMMEGYFVRTLGMHRVYNSAFMHMLRDEDNAKYRQLLKSTLEYNPEILKRYVNFMNNPDEETAVQQFGKGDKYFGVATLMATLPGLPMLGHGQVEGYAEKYGMEYHAPKWEESPDPGLVEAHRQKFFPLLHRRRLFADVTHFALYDLYQNHGTANEDVFAYSNRAEDDRGLVVYHNRFGDTAGWIKTSTAYRPGGEDAPLVQTELAHALGLPLDEDAFVTFRELHTQMEYIRSCRDLHENGLYLELDAYQCYVFLDFRTVYHTAEEPYADLNHQLNGLPVVDMESALRGIQLQNVVNPYVELVNPGMLDFLIDQRLVDIHSGLNLEPIRQVERKVRILADAICDHFHLGVDASVVSRVVLLRLIPILQLQILDERYPKARSRSYKSALMELKTFVNTSDLNWAVLFTWAFNTPLGNLESWRESRGRSLVWMDELHLKPSLARTLSGMAREGERPDLSLRLSLALVKAAGWYPVEGPASKQPGKLVQEWLADGDIRSLWGLNEFEGELYFNAEGLTAWLDGAYAAEVIEFVATFPEQDEDIPEGIIEIRNLIKTIHDAAERSNYQIRNLLKALGV